MATLMQEGFGLTWVLPEGSELIKKSLAPSFLFVDADRFCQSNANHRLRKRGIAAFVSVEAPLSVLAHKEGWLDAVPHAKDDPQCLAPYAERSLEAVRRACESGADAIVVHDRLFVPGALVDPLMATDTLMPLYAQMARAAADAEVPAIFSAAGDLRDYYHALAAAGFGGVHVAHPKPDCVEELFGLVRDEGLVPLGGIVTEGLLERSVGDSARVACALAQQGPALICDDGMLEGFEQVTCAVSVLSEARRLASEA